jgi:hypothetical protein
MTASRGRNLQDEADFAERLVRYVQRQFHALTGSIVMAVLGQGLVFGLVHC